MDRGDVAAHSVTGYRGRMVRPDASAGEGLDLELRIIRRATGWIPPVRGARWVREAAHRLYCRRPRSPVWADVHDFKLRLDPNEVVDGALLFAPQLYDHRETAFLKARLRPGHVFVDAGAHIGFYSLLASKLVGPEGRVLAIEAHPETAARLRENLALNSAFNVACAEVGLSDRNETLRLGFNPKGRLGTDDVRLGGPAVRKRLYLRWSNVGASSFLPLGRSGTVDVDCAPLLDVLQRHGFDRIDGLKLDIEGFEFRVLQRFFADADPSCHPSFVIIEEHLSEEYRRLASGDAVALLRTHGYVERSRSQYNCIMERR